MANEMGDNILLLVTFYIMVQAAMERKFSITLAP